MALNPVFITDIAVVLPNDPVPNDRMESLLGEVGGRASRARPIVLRSNGIKTRHYAIDPETRQPTHNNAQLTAEAVRGLVSDSFTLNDIDCLACGTTYPDQTIPNHGVMVHGELGSPPCEVVATAGVCVSVMTALKYAYMAVGSGLHTRAVATGSEISSIVMQARNFEAEAQEKAAHDEASSSIAFEKELLRWMLSDGASAALLRNEPDPHGRSLRIEWIDVVSYAGEMEPCMYAGAEKIDGRLVGWAHYPTDEREKRSLMMVKQDVRLLNENVMHYTVERPLATIAEKRGLTPDEIDHFVPHYSSEFFRERVFDSLQRIEFPIPYERWFTNLTTKGNTGSASLFIILEELLRSGRLREQEKILCYVPESGRFASAFMLLTVV